MLAVSGGVWSLLFGVAGVVLIGVILVVRLQRRGRRTPEE
jgi:hypothetical protein